MKAGIALATVAAVAFGGIAMAAGSDAVPEPVAFVETTAPVEPRPMDEPGEVDADGGAGGPADAPGSGDERSTVVALVPRYLDHSEELSGAERSAAISQWAKAPANRKTEDAGGEPAVDESEASGDAVKPSTPEQSEPASSGRSGEVPGGSGSRPGHGRGH